MMIGPFQGRTVCKRPLDFRDELTRLINRASLENGSNTPDFILAPYLMDCLAAFDRAVRTRDQLTITVQEDER